jgi:hypothetical protein
VDQHITASAKAHSAEIAELAELVRAVHSSVTALVPATVTSQVPAEKDKAPATASASTRRRRDTLADSRG